MIVATLASGLLFFATRQSVDLQDQAPGTVHYAQVNSSAEGYIDYYHQNAVQVVPDAVQKFRGVARQAFDYSCGSAALTTLLDGYVGLQLTERQTMNGLLNYGERERIIERRAFSLLDMKRFVAALGLDSGGFKGDMQDLKELDKPVIVLISYGGFDHFVVYKGYRDGRVFVADPALGNISFMENRFAEVWDNTLFMINPGPNVKTLDLLAVDEDDLRIVEDSTVNYHAFDSVVFNDNLYRADQLRDLATTVRPVVDSDPNSRTFNQVIDVPLRLYYNRK